MTRICKKSTGRTACRPAQYVVAAALALTLLCPAAAADEPGRAAGVIVTIKDEIDDILRDSLERRLTEAREAGAQVIVLELDTPGGLVTSALDIARMVKDTPADVHMVAWVHPRAYSAGALIALAADEIWMSPSSSIGDAAPIAITPAGGVQELGETERAKAESPILQEFRDSAARNGYNQLLTRAMVSLGTEVWWLEHTQTGERRFVTLEEKETLFDDADEAEREWKLVDEYTVTVDGQPKEIPVSQPLIGESELLTMSQYDAIAFGFARGIAGTVPELAEELQLAGTPARLEMNGWESFARWLNSPIIRGILLIIVLLGAYLEFHTPGAIVPGVTALIALVIFLAAPYAAGLASVWTFVLLGLGVILIGLEIFVIPGFGIAGIAGGVLVIVALLGSFVPAEPGAPPFSLPDLRGTWSALLTGLKVLTVSTLISLAGIILLAQYLPRTKLATGLVSENPELPATSGPEPTLALPGDVGVVTGDLRPAGQARFGHEIVDVCSQGMYVPAGQRVQVIRREGMNVVVRPLPEEGEVKG
ncbi:MAG: NfeD family protein [Planctomycetota bacterium]